MNIDENIADKTVLNIIHDYTNGNICREKTIEILDIVVIHTSGRVYQKYMEFKEQYLS